MLPRPGRWQNPHLLPNPGSTPRADAPRAALIAALLVAGSLLLYAPVREHAFINYDDPEYVTENPHVVTGLTAENLLWAFTSPHSATWHPLTGITHMLDVEIWGLRPGPPLIENAILHALSAALLFLFFWRTTGDLGASAFVAAVFAFHPLRVESVAWVSERKDVLSTFFWMLTLHAYAGYARSPGRARYAAVLVCFALGLLAKPMLVTLPFVLLLLDLWPLGRFDLEARAAASPARLLLEKLPLIALAIVVAIITFLAQRQVGAMVAFDEMGLGFRVPNAIVSYATYLWKSVWPANLAVFYPATHPVPLGQVAASAALLLAISALVAWQARPRRYLLVGWLWYLGVLVPVIGIVWVGEQARADRFTYLPQIGIAVMVAWGLPDLLRGWPPARAVLAGAATVSLAALAWATSLQLHHWRATEPLFEHALAVTERNYVIEGNLCADLSQRQQNERAMPHCEEALRLRPDFAKAHVTVGAILFESGRADEAIGHYEYALSLRPDSPLARFNYGLALTSRDQKKEALEQIEEALRLEPTYAKAHVVAAGLLEDLGRGDAAIEHLRLAVRYKPDLVAAHANLAIALERRGDKQEAIVHYREAARLAPDDVRAQFNLAAVLEESGAKAEALRYYREAQRVSPGSPEIQQAVERLTGGAS